MLAAGMLWCSHFGIDCSKVTAVCDLETFINLANDDPAVGFYTGVAPWEDPIRQCNPPEYHKHDLDPVPVFVQHFPGDTFWVTEYLCIKKGVPTS